ncbi:Nucleic-acid-binding protein, partial [Aphis craccivora]
NLDPKEHNLKLFQVSKLLNSIVKIEKPWKTHQPPQFKSCQLYGHTRITGAIINLVASNAMKITPLVTNLVTHLPNAYFVPALKEQKSLILRGVRRSAPITNKAENNRPPVPPTANISIEPPPIKLKNYAEVTKNHNNIGTSPSISTILSNFISNLNAIISPLISLLTTVLNSLLTKVAY